MIECRGKIDKMSLFPFLNIQLICYLIPNFYLLTFSLFYILKNIFRLNNQ